MRSDSEMRTQKKFVTRLVAAVSLFATLLSTTGFAQEKPKPVEKDPTWKELRELDKKGRKPPSGPSFFIAPLEGSKAVFSVLLSDANGQTVSGSFTLQQLDVFEAVLAEAKAFALTDEKVGSGTPIITRLMDQHEWSFFVDVSKIGNQSRLYVSLITINGKLTTEAGEITRGSKKEPSGLLLKMLSQVHEAKASVAQH